MEKEERKEEGKKHTQSTDTQCTLHIAFCVVRSVQVCLASLAIEGVVGMLACWQGG